MAKGFKNECFNRFQCTRQLSRIVVLNYSQIIGISLFLLSIKKSFAIKLIIDSEGFSMSKSYSIISTHLKINKPTQPSPILPSYGADQRLYHA